MRSDSAPVGRTACRSTCVALWQPRCHGSIPKTGGFASPPFGGFAFFSRKHRCLRPAALSTQRRISLPDAAVRHKSRCALRQSPIAAARARPSRQAGRRVSTMTASTSPSCRMNSIPRSTPRMKTVLVSPSVRVAFGPMTVTLRTASRRLAGARHEDVVVAHAVLLEIALVVARRRDRLVLQRDAARRRRPRVADRGCPTTQGLPQPVAEQARVAAGVHHRVLDAEPPQDLDAAIDRPALGDAAEVDAHARLAGTGWCAPRDRAATLPIVDAGQRGLRSAPRSGRWCAR